jgi:hypothetical protein
MVAINGRLWLLEHTMSFLDFLLWTIPFWIPAIIGVYLLINQSDEKLSRMAALLTLKPILMTPLWFMSLRNLSSPVTKLEPAHFFSILPGAGLTLIFLIAFRSLFSGTTAGQAQGLIALDVLRWVNSFLLISPVASVGGGALACLLSLTGLALPSVFAFIALTTSMAGSSHTPGEKGGI